MQSSRPTPSRGVWILFGATLLAGCAPEPPEKAPEPPPAARAAPTPESAPPAPGTRGIDVSHFQGQIDWASVAGSGIGFVFIKASEGIDEADPEFEANWRGAGAAGLGRGAYHFFDPDTDGSAQASFFLSRISGKTLELGTVLDVERAGDLTSEELATEIRAWLDAVEAARGSKPMIYTRANFWDTAMDSGNFSEYPLWIAEYEVDEPRIPKGWTSWAYWQDSETGKIPGISGAVDTDVAGPGPSS